MARYDRSYGRDYGARPLRGRAEWGEIIEYDEYGASPGSEWGGRQGRFPGTGARRERLLRERGGYPRGSYGRDFGEYGGSPGGRREMERPYVGRPWYPERYDAPYEDGFSRGYDRGLISERVVRTARYGRDFAREPFMPETAYLRHPEYDRPPTYHQNRWEQPWRYEVSRDQRFGDDEVCHEVKQRLYQDSWLDGAAIDVAVDDGVVTLRGEVNDFLEARYAWDDAWESEGVRGVINNLTVRADQPQPEHHGDMFAQDTEGR